MLLLGDSRELYHNSGRFPENFSAEEDPGRTQGKKADSWHNY
jgi:hypothetical protein